MNAKDSLKKRIEQNSETIVKSIADTLKDAIEGGTCSIGKEEYKVVWRRNASHLDIMQDLGLIEREPLLENVGDSFMNFAREGFPVTEKGFEEYEKLKSEGFYNN